MQRFYGSAATANYKNTVYAANIALEQHLADMLFEGDINRVLYATSDYAFRKRIRLQSENPQGDTNIVASVNSLNLPFVSYFLKDIQPDSDKPWWNNTLNVSGIFIPELRRKVRMTPVRLEYESVIFYHQYYDSVFGFNELVWDYSNETQIPFFLETKNADNEDVQLKMVSSLDPKIDFSTQYQEQDWLEQNRIRTVQGDFALDTWFIKENFSIVIPQKFILDFATTKQLPPRDDEYTRYEAVINYFDETVGDLVKV